MRRFPAFLASTVALALAVGGCATESTPYQPLSTTSRVAGGYTDQRLAEDRYSVTFAGNKLTSRETVETYLLFRAAELTLEKGYDWFAVVDREMEHRVEREIRPDPYYDPWFGMRYSYWKPYWRYYGTGIGWRYWDPYHADPFWTHDVDVRTVEQFVATAEIRLGRGPVPTSESRASDARQVIKDIGPHIEYPES